MYVCMFICVYTYTHSKPIQTCCAVSTHRYVLLVSGLNLGSSWCDQLSVTLLVDYITGQLGGPAVRHRGREGGEEGGREGRGERNV